MPGYFADDSMAVRVMRTRTVGLTYGQRALVMGAIHPRLYVGTATHTSHRESPYTRLALTARLFETVFLGTREEADRALAFTRKRHATVQGVLPEDAGPHAPAGTPYDANDPYLMYMTMAFTFDSVEVMHNLLVRPLTAVERADLWQDFVRWGELFGMPPSAAPASYPQFRASFDAYVHSDEPYLTHEAGVVGSYIAGIKRADYDQAPPLRPLFRTINHLVRGSLPDPVRRLYGLRWGPAHEAAFRSAVQAARTLNRRGPRFLPHPLDPVLHGTNAELYKLISRTEQYYLRRGKLSMPEATMLAEPARRPLSA